MDGNPDPKAGYGTRRAPCFAWSPDDAWVLGDAAFALDDAGPVGTAVPAAPEAPAKDSLAGRLDALKR